MDVRQLNQLLAEGIIDREDMWPRIVEYKNKAVSFQFEFGLKELPTEAGLIVVRGPRQYGKSTWLDLELRNTVQEFGKATAFYLNGDSIASPDQLEDEILSLEASYGKMSPIKRLFIDEITAIVGWEKVIKRLWDRGHIRDVLVITTGSKAFDLRRGSEKLPGRKGKLPRNDYVFLPISYRQFYENCHEKFRDKTWLAYFITGGSPILCNDLYQFDRLPEASIQIIRDWIFGEIASSGRSRIFFHNILQSLFRFAGTPVGFAKLARESGVANNTVASGYMEQLADLLCVLPSWQWDSSRKILLANKPCKFHFINLAATVALHPQTIRCLQDFETLATEIKGQWLEWLVAQEIWRRTVLNGTDIEGEKLGFWQSKTHEIDFVTYDEHLIEVKWGKAGPLDFSWFSKVFHQSKLVVVCQTPFETEQVRGVTPHDFLLNGWVK